MTDSIAIANYLDQKYPEPALYNNDAKSRDLELLDHYSKVFINIISSNLEKSSEDNSDACVV